VVHVAHLEYMRNAYKILIRKSEGKRPLWRRRRRCENNVRMGLREIAWDGVDWMHLAQDWDQLRAVVNEPLGSIKDGECLDYLDYLSDY